MAIASPAISNLAADLEAMQKLLAQAAASAGGVCR